MNSKTLWPTFVSKNTQRPQNTKKMPIEDRAGYCNTKMVTLDYMLDISLLFKDDY